MKIIRGRIASRLLALEATLRHSASPSTSLWLLKGETIEEAEERYRREGIALAKNYLPVFAPMTTEEWLAAFGGCKCEQVRH